MRIQTNKYLFKNLRNFDHIYAGKSLCQAIRSRFYFETIWICSISLDLTSSHQLGCWMHSCLYERLSWLNFSCFCLLSNSILSYFVFAFNLDSSISSRMARLTSGFMDSLWISLFILFPCIYEMRETAYLSLALAQLHTSSTQFLYLLLALMHIPS